MHECLYNGILSQLEQYRENKIVFWGASLFLGSFISNPDLKKYNILGIVDNDKRKWGTYLYGYKIFSPDSLNDLKPVCIIDTIENKYLNNYISIKNIISDKYQENDVRLLPNLINTYYDNHDYKIDLSKMNANCEYIVSSKKEVEFFESIGDEYKKYSEMVDFERLFLTTLIQRIKPKKILEVGVSKGGSSFLILNAMNTYKGAKLYSLDYNTECYNIKGKLTGFLLDEFPDLKKDWSLYTGGLSLNFLDKISSSINEEEKFDFCFIDTVHCLPGECLDVLQILPYMKQDGIIVLHDTNFQIMYKENIVNNLLMSSIRGKKLLPYPKPYPCSIFSLKSSFNNIGAIQLSKDSFSSLYEIFNILTLKWNYMPCYDDLKALIDFFEKHYSEYYSNYFKEIILLQEKF